MCGTIGTARQASAAGHARHAGTPGRAGPINGTTRQPGSAALIPPLADPQGNDMTGRWPLHSYLELGALPSAVPCARLHTREVLWEWGLAAFSEANELLVSELVTNAMRVSRANAQDTPIRLWLVSDKMQVVVLVWDASPLPPVLMDASEDAETGRGLLLVQALSTRWGWHFPPGLGGKVVWVQTVLE